MTWPSHDLTQQQTSRHQNTSLQSTKHHHHGTAEGSFTAKKWFGHRAGRSPCAHSIGKFFLCYIVLFLLETSAPGLSGHYWYALCLYVLSSSLNWWLQPPGFHWRSLVTVMWMIALQHENSTKIPLCIFCIKAINFFQLTDITFNCLYLTPCYALFSHSLWGLRPRPSSPALELIKLWVLSVLPSFLRICQAVEPWVSVWNMVSFIFSNLSHQVCKFDQKPPSRDILICQINIQTQPSRSDHHKTTSEESESPLICICPWNMLGQSIWEHTFKIF